MEQNENLRTERTRRKPFIKALVAVLVAALAAFVLLPVTNRSVEAAETPPPVTSWRDLREAINNAPPGQETVIEIANDIVAEKTDNAPNGTIDVSGNKTVIIKAKDGEDVTIYRKPGESDFPMFRTSGAQSGIILGNGLILTGETKDCPPAPTSGFTVTSSNGGSPEKTGSTTINAGNEVYINRPAADWAPENGYEFVGWKYKTSADGAVQSTKNNADICSTGYNVPQNKSGEMTVVAEYERTDFVVTWSNGVSGDGEKTQVWDLYGLNGATKKSVGDNLSFTPPDDWKPGDDYTFAGWKYILSDGTEKTTSGDSKQNVVDAGGNQVKMTKTAAEMKIVAQWTESGGGLSRDGGVSWYRQTDSSIPGVGKIGIDSGSISGYEKGSVSIGNDGKVYYTDSAGTYHLVNVRGEIRRAEGTYQNWTPIGLEYDESDPTKVYLTANNRYFGDFGWQTGWTDSKVAWKTSETYESSAPSYTAKEPEVYPAAVQPSYSESEGGSGGQGCDGNCDDYTKNDFHSGTTDAPRGFFVEVEKGTVTLAGATLKNFNTSTNKDETPKNVAPVVASGSSAKFIVQSGNIQNNIVGYIAIDGNSTSGANQIKQYIKGAAPNARRQNAPEPADGTRKRRNNSAGIDDGEPGSGITGTAGAIIYANCAQGEISGGSIGYNRADTGGIMVTGDKTFVEIKDGADINHNVGVQFGGGTTVEQGGSIYMSGGEIHDNVAWFGGGAVFATQNGVDWLIGEKEMSKDQRLDGNFTMDGGEVYGNNAFTRGGGFLVDSNGVALLSGVIRDNTSRVLGGAAYVMGDHPDYSYTLYVGSGQIYENEAMDADQNEPTVTGTAMSKKLNSATPCSTPDSLFGNSMSSKSDDFADFDRINDGTGGGVWTCSYGSTVLDLDASKVYIHDNTADGSSGNASNQRPGTRNRKDLVAATEKNEVGGQDFHSDNGGDGTLLMINADSTQWLDENTGGTYTPGEVDAEIRNLTYDGQEGNTTAGVQIYHNASRRGGGLAADGTFVFGEKNDVARVTAELDISKVWADDVEEKKPVIIRIGVENNGETAVIRDLELDGTEDLPTDVDPIHENAASGNEWSGGINLPVTVDTKDGDLITVFYIEGPDRTTYDPGTKAGTDSLAAALSASGGSGFKLKSDAKLTFTELVKTENGYEETGEYKFEPGEVRIEDLDLTVKDVTRVNGQGVKEHVLYVNFARIPLKAPLRNETPVKEEPKTEKYINNVVHQSLDAFDQKFTYSVMAYVPADAESISIKDELSSSLKFVKLKNSERVVPDNGIVVFKDNDHIGDGTGTVASDRVVGGNVLRVATGLANGTATENGNIDVNGKTITLNVTKKFLDMVRNDDISSDVKDKGFWIMLSYDAEYDPNYYDLKKVQKAENGWLNDGDSKADKLSYAKGAGDVRWNPSGPRYILLVDGIYYRSNEIVNQGDAATSWEKHPNQQQWERDFPPLKKVGADVIAGNVDAIKVPYNGFVIDGVDPHKGTLNQASYTLTGSHYGDSEYKTNIVTVEPKTEELSITKIWDGDEASDRPSSDDGYSAFKEKLTLQSKKDGEDPVTVTDYEPTITDNGDNTWTAKWTNLPKLDGVTYQVVEDQIEGYGEPVYTNENDTAALNEGTITNTKETPEEPEVEKYVNNKVHADIVNFDQEFEYSVMAFVPRNATKVEITDTLKDQLEFLNADPGEVLSSVIVYKDNTHKGDGSGVGKDQLRVAGKVAKNQRGDCSVTVDGKTVTLTLGEGFLNEVRNNDLRDSSQKSFWVKMSFKAKIAKSAYDAVAEKIASGDDGSDPGIGWEKVTDDGSVTDGKDVQTDGSHAGLLNKASYKVYVSGGGSSDYETNTVTIKPEITNVTAEKTWQDENGETAAWPDDVQSVTVNVYGAEEDPVDTLTLTKSEPKATSKDLPKLKNVEYTVDEVNIPGYVQIEGSPTGSGTADDPYVFTNKKNEGPQIEKYVNEDVHSNLVEFDKEFTYDIMAFVPVDADEIVISDKLVNALEFVSKKEDVEVAAKTDNDHTVKGSVSGDGTALGEAAAVSIEGQKLTVTVADATDYRGQWIQVTFKAKYTQETIDAAEVRDSKKIGNDGAVLGGKKPHTGTTNQASYDIRVGNEWTKDVKSNTVTVKAETVELEAEKKWKNADGSDADWPEGVTEVNINVLNGTDTVDTITLTAENPKVSSKKLPKLTGVTYELDEVEVPGYITVRDGNTFTNTEQGEPQIEKYINKDVDAHLVMFDKTFTYDIMAYVPADADSIEITDTLVDSLEFADTANIKVVAKTENDHKAKGSVAKDGTAVAVTPAVDGNTLTVTVDDAAGYRGQWIQVTFDAKYTDAAIQAAKVADSQTVTDNGTVISDIETHDGTANTASYKIKVGNEWSSDYESNTVTHDAETVQVEAEKKWKNADGTDASQWPAEVANVKVKVINDRTGKQVATITLTADKTKAKSKKLPKLTDVTYSIKENTIPGYISRVDGNVVVNTEGEGPEVEKYVNKDVTYDFENFDQTFEYEIMGYVTNDATEATFTDELNSVLEFVGNGNIKVYDMGEDNDHKTTVAGAGTEVTPTSAKAENGKLEVSFNEADITTLRGHWVKVTFDARITEAGYAKVAAKIAEKAKSKTVPKTAADDANWANIDDNGSVLIEIEGSHDGVPNEAKLYMNTENNGEFNLDTNTVTVEPKTVQLKATKAWKDAEDTDITEWPAGAKVTFALMKGETEVETKTLDKAGTVTFTAQPKLDGVTYKVVEKSVTGIEALQDGDATVDGNTWTFTNKVVPEEPEIEKYVNLKTSDLKNEARDGTVHADLYAFDEVYTYDIQAYVTKDAKYVVVSDQLVEVLEFAKVDDFRVAYKDGEGADGTIAPALTKESTPYEHYSADFGTGTEGKLVVTIGSDADDAEVLDIAGKWLQITFDAKIKDEYRTIEALKAKGVNVWTTITENDPVEDADVSEKNSFSGATAESHEGIINDASYTINKIAGAEPGNEWEYSDKSNTVTVQPEMTQLDVKKLWYGSDDADAWPEDIDSVTVGLYKMVLKEVGTLSFDYMPVYGTIDHDGNLITGGTKQAVYTLTKDESSKTINAPRLAGGIYYLQEMEIDGTPVKNGEQPGNTGIANMGIFDIIASYMLPIYIVDKTDPVTGEINFRFVYGTAIDNEKIETEKYVNNDVHADLVEFDKVFKYDIMAYVSAEATEVTITDTLVDALEFAKPGEIDSKAVKAETAADAGIKVVTKEANDHKVNGTVSEGGTDVTDAEDLDINVDIENKTLTVTFAGEETDDVKPTVSVAGKWVQVTFYAKYTDDVIKAANIGETETVTSNGAVLEGVVPHEGTANKASYIMKVDDDATVELVTNKVTVKPETTKIYVQKKVQNPDGTDMTEWPLGLTVNANVYKKVKNSDSKPEIVQTLTVNSLEPVESKDLPKLKDVEYTVDEVEVPSGYTKVGNVTGTGTKADPYVITNKKGDKPEIEKYVNKDVHQCLTEFDRAFTYDIMAYITKDADRAVITDTLVDALEFSTTGENKGKAYDKETDKVTDVIVSIVAKDANDHTAVTGTVANIDGTPVTNAVPDIKGQTLTVTIPDAAAVRGKWVQITFYAKYTDAAIAAAEVGNSEAVRDNGAVISAEYPSVAETAAKPAHEGTYNKAGYEITVNNEAKYSSESNTVTVDAENVEIPAKKEWKNADGSTADWPETEVEGVSTPVEVKVNVKNGDAIVDTITLTKKNPEGKSDKLPKLIGVDYKLDEETQVTGWYSTVEGNTVTNKKATSDVNVKISKADMDGTEVPGAEITVKDSEGKVVETWTSKEESHEITLKPGTYTMVENVAPEGFKCVTTEITFTVDEEGKVTVVTTKVDNGKVEVREDGTLVLFDEPEKPEIEKYVNYAVHKDIKMDDTFTYDILAYVTDDADTVTITDTLVDKIKRLDTVDVTVFDLGKENNHKPGFDIAGTKINSDATVLINGKIIPDDVAVAKWAGKTLTVTIDDAEPYRGHWIDVLFTVQIDVIGTKPDGSVKTLKEKYDEVKEAFEFVSAVAKDTTRTEPNVGNDPVVSDEDHNGVPNTASYEIGVRKVKYDVEGNVVRDENGNVVRDENPSPEYSDKSNTVTVKPRPVVEISKTDMVTGRELKGATLIVTDNATNEVVDEWVSGDKPKYIQLAPGNYTLTEITQPFGYNIAESIKFTVDENGLVGSDKVVMADSSNKVNEQFSYNVTLEKTWTDGYGNEVKWPEGVSAYFTIQYYDFIDKKWVDYPAGGTVKLTSTNSVGTFENLPAEIDGRTAQFRAVEVKIPGYTQATSTVTNLSAPDGGIMKAVNIPEIPVDHEVLISKNSLGGSEISGAHIVVYNADGSVAEEWDSTAKAHQLTLKPGTYTMVETVAPEGYQRVETAITFTLDAEGHVTLGTTTVDNGGKITVMDANHLVLEDAPKDTTKHEVLISKTDLGGTEIEGATIVLKDADGAIIDEWVSSTKAHSVMLPEGTYTMIETVAPKGYKQVTTEMTFTVDKDGNVTLVTTTVNNGGRIKVMDGNHVILEDAPEDATQDKDKTKPGTPSTSRRVLNTPSSANVSRATSTGDNNNTLLWIVLAAAAAAAMAGLGVLITRRRNEDD